MGKVIRSTMPLKHFTAKKLWADNVLDKPISYPWNEHNYDENDNDEGWRYIDPDFSECTEAEILTALDGRDAPEIEEDEDYEEYLERLRKWANDETNEHRNEFVEPMMSYYYPIGNKHEADPFRVRSSSHDGYERISEERGQAILLAYGSSVCLAIVDGEVVLALTGGGMDLSWEICEAYTLLGFLPPAHFELPRMRNERNTRNLRIVAACRRSYCLARKWMGQKLRDLRAVQADLVAKEKKT